jgi:type II secretory pathway pseudopilin PulG
MRAKRPFAGKGEQGFTLLEIVISAAIMLTVSLSVLLLAKYASRTLEARIGEQGAGIALAAQINRMQSDASSADAVWSPNADEIDFYAAANKSGVGASSDPNEPRPGFYWKYVYDPATRTVRRYDYKPVASMGVVRENATATPGYAPIQDVSSFSVRTITADKAVPGALARAYPVNVGGNGVVGGNAVIDVLMETPVGARDIHLTAGNRPSGFTVTNAVAYKAIVYRKDLTHRFWAGLASKTHVLIKGETFVSYDGWKTKAPWCDYQIYRDKNETYNARDPLETPEHMRRVCAETLKAPLPKPGADGSLPKGIQPFEAPATWYDGGVGP